LAPTTFGSRRAASIKIISLAPILPERLRGFTNLGPCFEKLPPALQVQPLHMCMHIYTHICVCKQARYACLTACFNDDSRANALEPRLAVQDDIKKKKQQQNKEEKRKNTRRNKN
jgi:hypothetical protein